MEQIGNPFVNLPANILHGMPKAYRLAVPACCRV
jgi:hypothetical protein